MAENSLDHPNNDLEMDMNDTPVKKTAINCTKDLEITTDMEMGNAIVKYLGLIEVGPVSLTKLPPKLESAQILRVRNYREDATYTKDCNYKLRYMIKKYSSKSQEKKQLFLSIKKYIKTEGHKILFRKIVTLNHQRGELKKIWEGRRRPADKKTATKDVFDMSSLDQCLPSRPGDIKRIAEKLAKEYLSYKEQKKQSFRKSEIIRILSSNTPQKKNFSCSEPQSKSLTRTVKKVYGDVKNVAIFSFRPVLNKGSNLPCTLGSEIVVVLKYSSAKTVERGKDKLKDGSSAAKNLRNSTRLPFRKDQQDDKQAKSVSLRREKLCDSLSLSRKLSRMRITSSRRGDLSLESDLQELDLCTNPISKMIMNLKRDVVEDLREFYKRDTISADQNKDPKKVQETNRRDALEYLSEFYKSDTSSTKQKNETEGVP